jgi:hypothetical protein
LSTISTKTIHCTKGTLKTPLGYINYNDTKVKA